MGVVYISIETDAERFELYREMWDKRGITGIRVDTVIEAIEKSIAIEKSKSDELLFIDIVADDIPDFILQLSILAAETSAPILVATSNYNDDEHHEALNHGADFYGQYCEPEEKNITAVLAAINSIQRPRKRKKSGVIACSGILIALAQRKVFIHDKHIELSPNEYSILRYLMENRGNVMTYKQIYRRVWGRDYQDSERDILRNAIKRLREKLKAASSGTDFIETVRDEGYRFNVTK